jgi:hypothetical protein
MNLSMPPLRIHCIFPRQLIQDIVDHCCILYLWNQKKEWNTSLTLVIETSSFWINVNACSRSNKHDLRVIIYNERRAKEKTHELIIIIHNKSQLLNLSVLSCDVGQIQKEWKGEDVEKRSWTNEKVPRRCWKKTE